MNHFFIKISLNYKKLRLKYTLKNLLKFISKIKSESLTVKMITKTLLSLQLLQNWSQIKHFHTSFLVKNLFSYLPASNRQSVLVLIFHLFFWLQTSSISLQSFPLPIRTSFIWLLSLLFFTFLNLILSVWSHQGKWYW